MPQQKKKRHTAQVFSLREPLKWVNLNHKSADGDRESRVPIVPAVHWRYEAGLARLARAVCGYLDICAGWCAWVGNRFGPCTSGEASHFQSSVQSLDRSPSHPTERTGRHAVSSKRREASPAASRIRGALPQQAYPWLHLCRPGLDAGGTAEPATGRSQCSEKCGNLYLLRLLPHGSLSKRSSRISRASGHGLHTSPFADVGNELRQELGRTRLSHCRRVCAQPIVKRFHTAARPSTRMLMGQSIAFIEAIFHLPIDVFLLWRYSVPIGIVLNHAVRTSRSADPASGLRLVGKNVFPPAAPSYSRPSETTSRQSNRVHRLQTARVVRRLHAMNPHGGNQSY